MLKRQVGRAELDARWSVIGEAQRRGCGRRTSKGAAFSWRAVIATKNNITEKAAVEILESIAQLAYENAKDSFTIPGLGKLVLVDRKARMGRNPATGTAIQIPAKRVVKFRVAKAAKDAILGSK